MNKLQSALATTLGLGLAVLAVLRANELDRHAALAEGAPPDVRLLGLERAGASLNFEVQIANGTGEPLVYSTPWLEPLVHLEGFTSTGWVDLSGYTFCGNGWSRCQVEPGTVVAASGWGYVAPERPSGRGRVRGAGSGPVSHSVEECLLRCRVEFTTAGGAPTSLYSREFRLGDYELDAVEAQVATPKVVGAGF